MPEITDAITDDELDAWVARGVHRTELLRLITAYRESQAEVLRLRAAYAWQPIETHRRGAG